MSADRTSGNRRNARCSPGRFTNFAKRLRGPPAARSSSSRSSSSRSSSSRSCSADLLPQEVLPELAAHADPLEAAAGHHDPAPVPAGDPRDQQLAAVLG